MITCAQRRKKTKISKHVNWHAFRHSLSTLLKNNSEDVRTIRSSCGTPTAASRWDVYTHGDTNALANVTCIFLAKPAA